MTSLWEPSPARSTHTHLLQCTTMHCSRCFDNNCAQRLIRRKRQPLPLRNWSSRTDASCSLTLSPTTQLPTIVLKALNLNSSYQPQSRIRRSNKTKSLSFHELRGRAAQTLLAQVKYLTAPLLTLGHLSLTEDGGGCAESPKTNGSYYRDAPKQFSRVSQVMHRERIHTRLVKWRVLHGDAFSIFFSKCGRDLFSADLKSPVKLQKRTITALVSDSSSLSSLNAAFIPLLSLSHPGSWKIVSRDNEEGRKTSCDSGPPRRSPSSQLRRRTWWGCWHHLSPRSDSHCPQNDRNSHRLGCGRISVWKYPSLADVLRQMALGKCWEDNSAGVIGYNSWVTLKMPPLCTDFSYLSK